MKIIIETQNEYAVTDQKKKELLEAIARILPGNVKQIKFKSPWWVC